MSLIGIIIFDYLENESLRGMLSVLSDFKNSFSFILNSGCIAIDEINEYGVNCRFIIDEDKLIYYKFDVNDKSKGYIVKLAAKTILKAIKSESKSSQLKFVIELYDNYHCKASIIVPSKDNNCGDSTIPIKADGWESDQKSYIDHLHVFNTTQYIPIRVATKTITDAVKTCEIQLKTEIKFACLLNNDLWLLGIGGNSEMFQKCLSKSDSDENDSPILFEFSVSVSRIKKWLINIYRLQPKSITYIYIMQDCNLSLVTPLGNYGNSIITFDRYYTT